MNQRKKYLLAAYFTCSIFLGSAISVHAFELNLGKRGLANAMNGLFCDVRGLFGLPCVEKTGSETEQGETSASTEEIPASDPAAMQIQYTEETPSSPIIQSFFSSPLDLQSQIDEINRRLADKSQTQYIQLPSAALPRTNFITREELRRQIDSVNNAGSYRGDSSFGESDVEDILGQGDGDWSAAVLTVSGDITAGSINTTTFTTSSGLSLPSFTPVDTTELLYNESGDLYWAGNLVSGSAVGTWSSSAGNVYRSTGKVGVGTTTPFANLSIQSAGGTAGFVVGSSTATSFIVNKDGKVGIGTANPTNTFDLIKTTAGGTTVANILNNSTTGAGGWTATNNAGNFAQFGVAGTAYGTNLEGGGFIYVSHGKGLTIATDGSGPRNSIRFGTGSGAYNTSNERMVITDGGLVGIGNPSPSVVLDVTGDIEYTGTITDVSDERLKDNIEDFSSGLVILQEIDVKTYSMKSTPGIQETGFIAQNVIEAFPQAVSIVDPENGYMGVSYVSFIPLLTKAIQEIADITGVFKENLVAWFSDATNGIQKMFVDEVELKTLCIADDNGERTCLTKAQIDALLSGNEVPEYVPEPSDDEEAEEEAVDRETDEEVEITEEVTGEVIDEGESGIEEIESEVPEAEEVIEEAREESAEEAAESAMTAE